MQFKLMTFSVALAALSACATQPGMMAGQQDQGPQEHSTFVDFMEKPPLPPRAGMGSESQARATEAVRFIERGDLPQASRAINAALQLDERNSWLHFLNGFIYHLQARQGDLQKDQLAIEGYQMALRLDPGNWIAQEFLGLAYLDLQQYKQAKEQFAEALLLEPDTTVSMYGLMVSSYLTGDPETACAMADDFRRRVSRLEPAFLRSSISVYGSCGDFAAAEQMRNELRSRNLDPGVVEAADQRLEQWRDFYRTPKAVRVSDTSIDTPDLRLAQAFSITQRQPAPAVQPMPEAPSPRSAVPTPAHSTGSPAAATPIVSNGDGASPTMVLVDVVILSMQDTIATSKGVNLLSALTLQLGSATAPGYSWTFDSAAAARTVITKAVTVPALQYSLNIADSNYSRNEVLARPTLAAVEGKPSKFFAGVNVDAGVLSTSTVGSPNVVPVDKRFGVTLAITPHFLPDRMVNLKVTAQRTFVMPSTNTKGFAYRFDIAETSTDANVVMKLGDTLVLSGLSEKDASTTRDGVPGLQDVPLAQYLFSSKQISDVRTSALILITPRAPIYVGTAQARGRVSDSVEALRKRLGFPVTIPPNVEAIVNSLNDTELFRQFRQGDVSMEHWDHASTTADRLRQALTFLYY